MPVAHGNVYGTDALAVEPVTNHRPDPVVPHDVQHRHADAQPGQRDHRRGDRPAAIYSHVPGTLDLFSGREVINALQDIDDGPA